MDKVNEKVEIVNYYLETVENMVKAEMTEQGATLVMKYVSKLVDSARDLQIECDKLPARMQNTTEWVES